MTPRKHPERLEMNLALLHVGWGTPSVCVANWANRRRTGQGGWSTAFGEWNRPRSYQLLSQFVSCSHAISRYIGGRHDNQRRTGQGSCSTMFAGCTRPRNHWLLSQFTSCFHAARHTLVAGVAARTGTTRSELFRAAGPRNRESVCRAKQRLSPKYNKLYRYSLRKSIIWEQHKVYCWIHFFILAWIIKGAVPKERQGNQYCHAKQQHQLKCEYSCVRHSSWMSFPSHHRCGATNDKGRRLVRKCVISTNSFLS